MRIFLHTRKITTDLSTVSDEEYSRILDREEELGRDFVNKFIETHTDGKYSPRVGVGWEYEFDGFTRIIKFCIDTDCGY